MTNNIKAPSKLFNGHLSTLAWLLAGLILVVMAVMLVQRPSGAADVVVYKSPSCGCCTAWVKHLEQSGFSVAVNNRQDMDPVKRELGIPTPLQSCHTAQVGDYLIEGHVPADLIAHLLEEQPPIKGLAVPGMPMGSPGMDGPRKDDYEVLAFQADGQTRVYARR